jgi:hypothetical protein
MSLYAEEKGLGDILQKVAQDKPLGKSAKQQKIKKQTRSRFVFKDEYTLNGIGSIDKSVDKNKSKTYDYENRSRFKFKFNDGYQQSNLVGGYGSGGMGGSMGAGPGGSGSGGGRK